MSLRRFRLILSFLLVTIALATSGQVLEWSNTQKLRGNSIYTTVIGEDETGIYVLRHRNKFLSKFIVLERYRHNLGMESSKSYLLKNTRILFADINEAGILLIKEVFDKKTATFKLSAIILNNSFESTQPEILITWSGKTHSGDDPAFIIKTSPDHKYYLILSHDPASSSKSLNRYTIIDQKISIIKTGGFDIDQGQNSVTIEDVIFERNLKFSLLLSMASDSKGFSNYAIYEQNTLKRIKDSIYSFEKPVLYYNPVTMKKGVSGFYTSSVENGFEGDFSITWTNLKEDSLIIKKRAFNYSMLKELAGESKAQTGFLPGTYVPIKLICRTDGGFVKISENTFTQKEQDMMVVNGVPSTQGKNIYTFENILVQNFDSLGNLAWENWVIKNQNSINDGGLLGSAFVSATPYSINLLFNDPIAAGGDIVLAKFLLDGQREIKVVAKGEEMNAFIIPEEGSQISGDKIIVPVLKDRKFALLKITFKQ